MSNELDSLSRCINHAGHNTAKQSDDIARHLLSLGSVFMPRRFDAEQLDQLELGSVLWVFDNKTGDANSWQLFDDVDHLRDEFGELASKAWASAAYKTEKSSADLIAMSGGSVSVLREGVWA